MKSVYARIYGDIIESGAIGIFNEHLRKLIMGIAAGGTHEYSGECAPDMYKEHGITNEQFLNILNDNIKTDTIFRFYDIMLTPSHQLNYMMLINKNLIVNSPIGIPDCYAQMYYYHDGDMSGDIKTYSLILIAKAGALEDNLTHSLKHELAHIVLYDISEKLEIDIFTKYMDDLSTEDLDNFKEFICDFIPYHAAGIVNNEKPIDRIEDEFKSFIQEQYHESYIGYINGVREYFNDLEETQNAEELSA